MARVCFRLPLLLDQHHTKRPLERSMGGSARAKSFTGVIELNRDLHRSQKKKKKDPRSVTTTPVKHAVEHRRQATSVMPTKKNAPIVQFAQPLITAVPRVHFTHACYVSSSCYLRHYEQYSPKGYPSSPSSAFERRAKA